MFKLWKSQIRFCFSNRSKETLAAWLWRALVHTRASAKTDWLSSNCYRAATPDHVFLLASPITEASLARSLHFSFPKMGWLSYILSLSLSRSPSLSPSHSCTHTYTCTSPRPLLSWCTCLPALQASSAPIKGAELFSSRKLIQHLSPGFILGIEHRVLCEHECNMRVCVCTAESGRRSIWVSKSVSFSVRSRKKGNIVCGSFVKGFESGHMGSTRPTVFFSVVMDYQRPLWEEMGFLFGRGSD